MSTSIITNKQTSTNQKTLEPAPRWQTLLLGSVAILLLILAIGMRLYHLGAPFDRDGYDEGVYWQSLRSMATGHTLYQQIFYSQPPFFLLSTYPFFALFGSTLWSARLGIAVVSLFGLLGAFLLGRAINRRIGSIVALLLLTFDPLYLAQSQKIEAEISAAAFSLLAVGAIYLWEENPDATSSLYLAALSGIALVLGTLCKLLSISAVVPVGLLLLARLWQIWRKQPGTSRRSWRPLFVFVLATIVTALVVLLPFAGAYAAMVQQVITFHTTASTALINEKIHNKELIKAFLQENLLLVIAALYGLVASLLRRDWRVLPLLGWSLATLYLLWQQVPLFPRHFVSLTPSLISLTVVGVSGRWKYDDCKAHPRSIVVMTAKVIMSPFSKFNLIFPFSKINPLQVMTALAIVLILVTVGTELPQYPPYYKMVAQQSSGGYVTLEMRVANDVRNSIAPDQYIVTDGQFIAALADRNTPPELVDTSMVRIASGYLTSQQLIAEVSLPQVHAVLFFTNRLRMQQLAAFYTWVTQHFRLQYKYAAGQELWVR